MKCVFDLIEQGQQFKADNNTWIVGDISTSGFYISIDGDSIWGNSIDIDIERMTYSKDSGGITNRKYNILMTQEEIQMCVNILGMFKEESK